jgi:hypothetical protein
MTEQPSVARATEEPQGPPLPKWAYAIVNPTLSAIIRSPMHRLVSGSLMLLIFDGRKSGRRYSIPVGYLEEGSRLYVFSHSAWAKNFIGGAPVGVRLRGELRRGNAFMLSDPAEIDKVVRRMATERGEEMGRRMGFLAPGPDGTLQPTVPKGTYFIGIDLAG